MLKLVTQVLTFAATSMLNSMSQRNLHFQDRLPRAVQRQQEDHPRHGLDSRNDPATTTWTRLEKLSLRFHFQTNAISEEDDFVLRNRFCPVPMV